FYNITGIKAPAHHTLAERVKFGTRQRQANGANLPIQCSFQQGLGGSFLVDPLHCRLDDLIVHEFGLQFAPEAMGSEGAVLREGISILFSEFAVVKVTEFAQAS